MKKVLIICGHPDYKNSLANKTILSEIEKNCPQVEIRKISELYPDCKIDVKVEQNALESADVIIFQFPTHWYNVPGILKIYIDTVMEHGWAYGSEGTALKGKIFIISTTAGAPEVAYSENGVMKHKLEDFYFNIAQYAALCGMDCKKFFGIYGAMCIPGVTTYEQKANLIEKFQKHADEIIDFLKTL